MKSDGFPRVRTDFVHGMPPTETTRTNLVSEVKEMLYRSSAAAAVALGGKVSQLGERTLTRPGESWLDDPGGQNLSEAQAVAFV